MSACGRALAQTSGGRGCLIGRIAQLGDDIAGAERLSGRLRSTAGRSCDASHESGDGVQLKPKCMRRQPFILCACTAPRGRGATRATTTVPLCNCQCPDHKHALPVRSTTSPAHQQGSRLARPPTRPCGDGGASHSALAPTTTTQHHIITRDRPPTHPEKVGNAPGEVDPVRACGEYAESTHTHSYRKQHGDQMCGRLWQSVGNVLRVGGPRGFWFHSSCSPDPCAPPPFPLCVFLTCVFFTPFCLAPCLCPCARKHAHTRTRQHGALPPPPPPRHRACPNKKRPTGCNRAGRMRQYQQSPSITWYASIKVCWISFVVVIPRGGLRLPAEGSGGGGGVAMRVRVSSPPTESTVLLPVVPTTKSMQLILRCRCCHHRPTPASTARTRCVNVP